MHINVAAFTEPTLPPPGEVVAYISANTQDWSGVTVTARDRSGKQVDVEMTWPQWRKFVRDAFASTCTTSA